jgi:hypothetical protein
MELSYLRLIPAENNTEKRTLPLSSEIYCLIIKFNNSEEEDMHSFITSAEEEDMHSFIISAGFVFLAVINKFKLISLTELKTVNKT